MISAMYENGGNTTQRLLDGHPELYVYPYESQLGTRLVSDYLVSMYPAKYRWPVFDLEASPEQNYEAIIDEECKVRIKTPQSSKFRDTAISLSDTDRRKFFVDHLKSGPQTRARAVEAFFVSTFQAWKDFAASGLEHVYVGYSPIIVVDADKILRDLPGAHVLHVVRNPWSAYADTKKRAVPLSMAHYLTGWTLCQHYALSFKEMFPDRIHILRYEDIIRNPQGVLGDLGRKIGFGPSTTMSAPSWNGKPLKEVYPWGTIRIPTPEANIATGRELSETESTEVVRRTKPLLREFGYEGGLLSLQAR